MRIGPLKIKLKPLLVYTPLFFIPIGVFNWYDYRQTNLQYKRKEDEIIIQLQTAANKLLDEQFPTVYFDPQKQGYISMEELEGLIKVYIFADQNLYRRVSIQMKKQLQRFQINYFNIVNHFDKIPKQDTLLQTNDKVENQIIVMYDNNVIYFDKLTDNYGNNINIIDKQITKQIDKQFLSKIKF